MAGGLPNLLAPTLNLTCLGSEKQVCVALIAEVGIQKVLGRAGAGGFEAFGGEGVRPDYLWLPDLRRRAEVGFGEHGL